MLRPIWILFKAHAKTELKSVKIFLANLLTPIVYPIIFLIQILIAYEINPHAFFNLPKELYITGMFCVQVIFWLSFDRSMRYLTQRVVTADLDYYLIRPINIFFYKYFRHMNFLALVMLILSYIATLVSAVYAGLDVIMILKLTIFTVLVSLIYLNIKCIFYGFVFFSHDARQIGKFHQALEDLVWNKPQDIFPAVIKFTLTYLLPYIIVSSYIYELLRHRDPPSFWLLIAIWLVITMWCNNTLWKKGFKKYESMG